MFFYIPLKKFIYSLYSIILKGRHLSSKKQKFKKEKETFQHLVDVLLKRLRDPKYSHLHIQNRISLNPAHLGTFKQQQTMNNSILNEKILLVSISIFSLLTIAVGFFNALTENDEEKMQQAKKSENQQQKQQQDINKQLDNLNHQRLILNKKAESFHVRYLQNAPHIVTPQCLKQIFEFTPTIIDKKQLQNIYVKNRKARRTVFSLLKGQLCSSETQLQIYYRFVCTFEEEIQYLIECTQKDFVVILNLDYETITDSIDFHMCQPQNEFAPWIKEWSQQIKQQLKQKLHLYDQPISSAQICDIVKFQIQCLINEGSQLQDAVTKLHLQTQDEQEAVPTFMQAYLEDLVNYKFGIEVQQVNLAPEDLTQELEEQLHILSELQNSVLEGMISNEPEVLSDEAPQFGLD